MRSGARPELTGRRALVTGAAGGLGYETALALARAGAAVVIADRDAAGGAAAAARIRAQVPAAVVESHAVDLADLPQVRTFGESIATDGRPLDLLVNNAGILPSAERRVTTAGVELSLAIALLGHFALTGIVLPALRRAAAPRVVSVTSLVAAYGRIDPEDLACARRYEPTTAYYRSKLAVLMFALELEVRARRTAPALQSLAAHPGIARTAIGEARRRERPRRLRDRLELWALGAAMRFAGQTAADGALPILHAATAPDARGGELYGPGGFQQWSGPPARLAPPRSALDAAARERLWAAAERLTGIRLP